MLIVNLDVMLAKRKMSVTELSARVGITIDVYKRQSRSSVKLTDGTSAQTSATANAASATNLRMGIRPFPLSCIRANLSCTAIIIHAQEI